MTVLEDRQLAQWQLAQWELAQWEQGQWQQSQLRQARRLPVPCVSGGARMRPARRPAPARPAVASLRYRGTGVAVSRVPHGRRPVSTSVALMLAGVTALITLWLGTLAQVSGGHPAAAGIPERLAVVQVQAGETLQQLARRVAPDSPAGTVVERIRDLNELESASVEAGQTLIAPLG